MKNLIQEEQTSRKPEGNFIIEGLKNKSKAPVYPMLISEDRAGFEKSVEDFLSVIKQHISVVKGAYVGLEVEEPFDDDTFHQLCISANIAHERYAKKVNKIADLIGVNSGLVDKKVLNQKHPNLLLLTNLKDNLQQRLSTVYDRSKAQLRPCDVININGKLQLNQDAYNRHLEAYRAYVNDLKEHIVKAEIDRFADSYNRFIDLLNGQGYGQHLNGLHPYSYLNNFFLEKGNYHLVPLDNAQTFLAKFTKDHVVVG